MRSPNTSSFQSGESFCDPVCEGTLEYRILIDYIIDSYSKVAVEKMKPPIREILRSAVYQLKFMDSVPDSAVCNEAVKLAQKKGFYNLKPFVNGGTAHSGKRMRGAWLSCQRRKPCPPSFREIFHAGGAGAALAFGLRGGNHGKDAGGFSEGEALERAFPYISLSELPSGDCKKPGKPGAKVEQGLTCRMLPGFQNLIIF